MSDIEKLKHATYIIFHPFNGFYEMKYRGMGSFGIATTLFVLYGVMGILAFQYTGFIVKINPLFRMNSISIFITTLFPYLLFIIGNWSVVTLFDGKGSLLDIYMVICYSLIPLIVFNFVGLIFSNFIILEEIAILNFFLAIGNIWFYFIAFCGLCTIHEYTVVTNIKTLVITSAAVIIIIFLCMLYYTLIGNMVSFVSVLMKELLKRW